MEDYWLMFSQTGLFENTLRTLKPSYLPYKTIIALCALWFLVALINGLLILTGHATGTTIFFPISIFTPVFNLHGILYAGLFSVLFIIGIVFSHRMITFQIWALGVFLLICGNLIQGGLEEGFLKPFYGSDDQYYYDAIDIQDVRTFLTNFNDQQSTLSTHSRTHPPFAVLLHYSLLKAGSGHIAVPAVVFILLSSFVLIVIRHLMIRFGNSSARASQFAFLYAVIPAFNIYGAVSIDGLIAACASLWVLGAAFVLTNYRPRTGMLLAVAGIVLMNALTFLGTFLIAVTTLAAIREIILHRSYRFATILCIAAIVCVFLYIGFKAVYDYDHIGAFLAASHLENPNGFLAIHAPLKYIMTRLEDIFEIGLFLSLGVTAVCIRPDYLLLNPRDWRDDGTTLFHIGIAVLLLMFLTGALKTGETARACSFIYPFLFPLVRKVNDETLRSITIIAGVQTVLMQLVGFYFW
jgi:hypothetical protein